MPFAVELYFDSSTEACIRKVWETLDEARIGASMHEAGYRPHVSLGVYNCLEADVFEKKLSTFAAGIAPFPLSFSNVGIFSTSEGVVFLGATVTERLLNVHTRFHRIFKKYAQEQREYYAVGKWVPHCTLAFGLAEHQIAEAVSICSGIALPISAKVKEIGLVAVSPTSCQMLCSFNLRS